MNKDALIAERNRLDAECACLSQRLQQFPRNHMGLTPDDVKQSPEYRQAKQVFDRSFQALRAFNGKYAKVLRHDR